MKPKDASANGKRLKYVLYAIWIVSFVLMIYGLRAPVKYRLLVEFVALTLVTSVPGYLSGRYIYRANNEKLKSRASVIIALVLLCVGLILEHEWMLIVPLAGGYLIGYVVGWSVCNRIRERYGDSPEGNELMNPVYKPLGANENQSGAYLKSLDAESRRVIYKLMALKLVVSLGVIGIVVWMIIADTFGHLVHALFVRPGDGTLYFMATEPWTTGIPMIFLSLCVIESFNRSVIPRLAGKWKSCWLEYAQLSDSDEQLYNYCMNKPILRYIAYAIGVMAVLGSILVLTLSADQYVKVTDKGITINRFWGFGAETYRWSDIKEVNTKRISYRCNRCGKMHTNVKQYILFNNGDIWKPDYDDPRLIDQCDSAFAYIEKRAKRRQ